MSLATNSLSVSNFVLDRKNDVIQLNTFIQSSTNELKRKGRMSRLFYGTRSFRRQKRCKIDVAVGQRRSIPHKNRIVTANNVNNCYSKLLTHNWHSKRFSMKRDQGCFISYKSNSFSTKYFDKHLSKSCVVQDQSYLRCILVTFDESTNIYFSRIMDQGCALFSGGFGQERNSKRPAGESIAVIHKIGLFPNGCIGPVLLSFVSSSHAASNQTLDVCLWIHPSIFNAVFTELQKLQQLVRGESKLGTFEVQVHDKLNRFSLRGGETANVMMKVLGEDNNDDGQRLEYIRSLLTAKHLNRLCKNGDTISGWMSDPRSKHRSTGSSPTTFASLKWPRNAHSSPLWCETQLAEIVATFRSDHSLRQTEATKRKDFWSSRFADKFPTIILSSRRSSNELPVTDSKYQKIPFLLVRKHSEQEFDSQSSPNNQEVALIGWDLVVPRVWGGVVWTAIQFAGAVMAAGVCETQHLQKNASLLSFPRDFPDTFAGQIYWTGRTEVAERKNAALPPRKRHGEVCDLSATLRYLSSFYGPTGTSASSNIENDVGYPPMMVVRGSHYSSSFSPPPYSNEVVESLAELSIDEEVDAVVSLHIPPLPRLSTLTLLYVTLTMTGRGLPRDLAEILCPSSQDRSDWVRHVQAQREKLRNVSSSEKQQATLSRHWRGHRMKCGVFSVSVHGASTFSSQVTFNDREGRHVMGVITSGQQPHMNNNRVVIGLCDALSLNRMFRDSFGRHMQPQAHRLVLVRNSCSPWLRPALLEIHA